MACNYDAKKLIHRKKFNIMPRKSYPSVDALQDAIGKLNELAEKIEDQLDGGVLDNDSGYQEAGESALETIEFAIDELESFMPAAAENYAMRKKERVAKIERAFQLVITEVSAGLIDRLEDVGEEESPLADELDELLAELHDNVMELT